MKKRLAIGIMLILIIFLAFVLIRETAKKYNLQNNIMKNCKYYIDNFTFFV